MLMFGWDFEVGAWSRFWRCLIKICVRTCDMTYWSFFGKQNSILGSVVPLAMFFLSKDTNTEMPSVKEKAKEKLVFITRFCNWWANALEEVIFIGIYWLPFGRTLTAAAPPKCNGLLLQVIYPISPKIWDSISSQRVCKDSNDSNFVSGARFFKVCTFATPTEYRW